MAGLATAFLALSLSLGTAHAATAFRVWVSHPEALIEWGNADSSSELSDEDGIVTKPLRPPANHRRHKRHPQLQHKRLALSHKQRYVHHHHSRASHHGSRRKVKAHSIAKYIAAAVAPLQNRNAESQKAHSNGTTKGMSGLVSWHTEVHSEVSDQDPSHLSALDTNIYSAQAAPQVILDKEHKINTLEEQNDRVSVEFHQLDAAYRDQQLKIANLRTRFENDQESIARGVKDLEASFTGVSQQEGERKKLLQEQRLAEKVIEEEMTKNVGLLHVLELKNRAESDLREQLTSLRKQVNSDQKNEISVEAVSKVELQNQTKKLGNIKIQKKNLKLELRTLASRLKAQQADKEELKRQQEALTEENSRLTAQNEKLEHLQSEKVAQMKALQLKVRDDRAERVELQRELDTLETTGVTPQPSEADTIAPSPIP